MKKLILLIAILLVTLTASAAISVTKVGDYIRVTGVTRTHSPLATNDNSTIYFGKITQVVITKNRITFHQDKKTTVTFAWSEVATKYGQTTPAGWVEYLMNNSILE